LRGPAQRHFIRKVNQRSVAKNTNTVIESGVDVAADVAAIHEGQATKVGNRFIVNGRIYGVHVETLYPISGPGFHQLSRGAFKALGVYNTFGNTNQATEILNRMGITNDQRATALKAWRSQS